MVHTRGQRATGTHIAQTCPRKSHVELLGGGQRAAQHKRPPDKLTTRASRTSLLLDRWRYVCIA
eukprot:6473873-Pyramimonas_sp.AAC.1